MPELPEVETTRQSLSSLLGAQVVKVLVRQPKLRWQVPDNLAELEGSVLTRVDRRAKYLILHFAGSSALGADKARKLIVHLGMSGSLQQYDCRYSNYQNSPHTLSKHEHVVFEFASAERLIQLSYHDPRRFGALVWYESFADKLFNHLGPEPLSDAFGVSYLHSYTKQTKRPIKSVIMDQSCVVGVGNIYATESLYLAGIRPSRAACRISKARLAVLVGHIKQVLGQAIEKGGSTLRDYRHHDGKTGYFQQQLLVYGKQGEPCPACGEVLKNIKINNRASVYCAKCQT